VQYHFQDSLAVKQIIDVMNRQSLADVGSGAGFPGIPLAIVYPHLSVMLIEVMRSEFCFA
jgi:16S rRNA (guanine527-N7)-methyltransferase